LAIIAAFYLFRGRISIEGGRIGTMVERFNPTQLVVHWFVAGLFVLLGITGLVLLYGRFVLIPLLGSEGFSLTASACKEAHNLFGPIFPFAVLAVFVYYVRGNGFRRVDVKWFLKGGGLFSKHGHAPSERFNAGQKVWFWLIVVLGTVISISGFVLDFPNFGQSRHVMELAHFSHGLVAIAFIAASLGHIYIGTVGMEGALEAMTTGKVDANWAKEHHDLWYQEMERQGLVDTPRPVTAEAAENAVPETKG
jgi:formate dehydrogenase subunit gamma